MWESKEVHEGGERGTERSSVGEKCIRGKM